MSLRSALRALLGGGAPAPAQPAVTALRTRRWDGAAGGRRWGDGRSVFGDVNAEIGAAGRTLAARGRYFARNNGWIANGVEAIVTAEVGTGIVPQSQARDRAVRELLHKAWRGWVDQADYDGRSNFYGLQALASRAMVEDGEALIRLLPGGPNGLFQCQLIPADLLDASMTRELSSGRIVAGVEFDAQGRRVAYHILRSRPGDGFATTSAADRVDARDVVHLFKPLAAGQVRGVSRLAPILLRVNELDQAEDAHLVLQKVAGLFNPFIVSEVDGSPSFGGGDAGTTTDDSFAKLSPGDMWRLTPGEDVKYSDPPEVEGAIDFMKLTLRGIAAGLGVPEYLVTGDLSQANYSSLRAALVEFKRRTEGVQFNIYVPQFLVPVWRRFVTAAVLSGAVKIPGFEQNPADAMAVEWMPPAWPWVDPVKDIEAEQAAIGAGLKSRRQAVAERGYDVEVLDREIAADRDRAKALGLVFGTAAAPAPAPAAPPAEKDPAADEEAPDADV